MYQFNRFDHFDIIDLEHITKMLQQHGCHVALIKCLPKNANDKNQIYIHSDASLLNSLFSINFRERGESSSLTKHSSKPGKLIPEGIFESFSWLGNDGQLAKTKACKVIVYAQYPEARLSGFKTIDGEMPRSLSIDYIKRSDCQIRYMIIGATKLGEAISFIAVNPSSKFIEQFKKLNNYFGSSVCKAISIEQESGTKKLEKILTERVAGKKLLGCRFDKHGNTIPFVGTQVHGYTLEHACGICPNANKDGDIFGIELKCFTRKKLTLFTPEPDGGLYKDNFSGFMMKYGYEKDGVFRVTGLHRAYQKNNKTALTLKISCLYAVKYKDKDGKKKVRYEPRYYNPDEELTKQMTDMKVILEDSEGAIAASWSVERLLNCWGTKHNEVVYFPAEKLENKDQKTLQSGYKWRIQFSNTVLWCTETNADLLFKAIHNGTIYLDPAPKYDPNNLKNNKRRSQWRINNIYNAAETLYKKTTEKILI